jgi:hypothetical protein
LEFGHILKALKDKPHISERKEPYLRTEVQCEGGVSGLSNARRTTREKNTPTSACIVVIAAYVE